MRVLTHTTKISKPLQTLVNLADEEPAEVFEGIISAFAIYFEVRQETNRVDVCGKRLKFFQHSLCI